MSSKALFIGNSDGIGLAASRALLEKGCRVLGVSRSPSPIDHPAYAHWVVEVQSKDYVPRLTAVLQAEAPVDICVFCAGIGEMLDPALMENEVETFDVNLLGMVRTAAVVIPLMVANGKGHFLGISSLADEMISAEAPGYHASKAGFSNYLEGLALALRPKGVSVTNVRFGFVDTKMAKGDVKPFMISVDRAARHLLTCIEKKPARFTAPRRVIPLVMLRRWALKMSLAFGR